MLVRPVAEAKQRLDQGERGRITVVTNLLSANENNTAG